MSWPSRALPLVALLTAAACDGRSGAQVADPGHLPAPLVEPRPPLEPAALPPVPARDPPPEARTRPGGAPTSPAPAPAPAASPSAAAIGAEAAIRARIRKAYLDPAAVEARLRDAHARHPALTALEEIGTTRSGRPILALAIGRRASGDRSGPAILLSGAIHGDEPLSTALVLDAADELLERAAAGGERRLAELVVWCVPIVNPDGAWAFLENFGGGRKNGKGGLGVDLNRNFPFRWGSLRERGSRSDPMHRWYRGPAPGSEPETQAILRLAERERPVASISYHVGTVAVLAPYTVDGVESPAPNEAWIVAQQIVARMPRHPDGPLLVRKNLYPVDGTDQDHLRAAYGTLALLLESARVSWEAPAQRDAALAAVRPAWSLLADRLLDGPSLEGHVRGADGAPLEAVVEIAELAPRAGERWTTRPRDGRFDRYLPAPGKYTVRVTAAGRAPAERAVEVTGRARLEITLP